jgi:hypothetical protein
MDEPISGPVPEERGGLRKWWLPGCMILIFAILLLVVGGTWLAGGFEQPDLNSFKTQSNSD